MPCPCCSTCACSDNQPSSVFVTIQDMSGIDGFYSPSAATAIKSVLVGNTYELTRECGEEVFLYETDEPGCRTVICSSSTKTIRMQYVIQGGYLLVEAWSTLPCAFVYGRTGTSSFDFRGTPINCSGGSAEIEIWNRCLPEDFRNFRVADVLLEW
jgi:hypothetical protein